jgi:hypothetical protein
MAGVGHCARLSTLIRQLVGTGTVVGAGDTVVMKTESWPSWSWHSNGEHRQSTEIIHRGGS